MLPGLRTVIAVVVAVAAWLVTSPAWASMSAPQCDHRGATTFGPAPTLDPPTASVDIGQADDSECLRALLDTSYEQGNAPSPDAGHASLEAVLNADAPAARAPFVRAIPVLADQVRAPPGVRHQVERPPRDL